jgi:hypothetical protein
VFTPGHGQQLGKGPYRRFDATPSPDLFASIVVSLEAAHEELARNGKQEASRCVHDALQQVRSLIQQGDFTAATRQAAEALASFAATIPVADRAAAGPAGDPLPESS